MRKLGPDGDVSHEEALGGQAIRENARGCTTPSWTSTSRAGAASPARADSLLGAAREVLGQLQQVRENYHMIDDEFQLPVLAARYLADSTVPVDRKRAFLLDSTDGRRTAAHAAAARDGARRHA